MEAWQDPTSPETISLNWLITDDPLQLDPNNPEDQFRLGQRYALLNLWFSSSSGWNDETGWLELDDECAWFGVTCQPQEIPDVGTQNVVTAIEMDDNGVQALPLDIAMLRSMTILSMANNDISGELPSTLPTMTALVELYLEENSMEQDLSNFDWSTLTNLEVLRLGANRFSGTLSNTLWTLINLQELILDNNRFTGTISDQVAELVNLVVFDVNANRVDGDDTLVGFTGPLPVAFTQLPKLEVLDLGRNSFQGTIPPEYASFAVLKEINLSSNEISGAILEGLGSPQLQILRVGFNLFDQAAVPEYIYGLTGLQVLSMDSCGLFGALDARIGSLVNLEELSISFNFLNGDIPADMGNLVNLKILSMRDNEFTGSLDFVAGMTQLIDLNIANNAFTGLSDMSGLSSLNRLQAQNNQFAGAGFPESLTQLGLLGKHVSISTQKQSLRPRSKLIQSRFHHLSVH